MPVVVRPNSSISTFDGAVVRKVIFPMLWILVGFMTALIATEGLLWAFPVATGMPRTKHVHAWPMYNYRPKMPYTYSRGWDFQTPAAGVTNNFGQLSPFDYSTDKPVVVVIGDSYVESKMNPFEYTLPAYLQRHMPDDVAVMGFGASGLSIADYLVLLRELQSAFKVIGVVVVQIDGDISESLERRLGWARFSTEGGQLRLLPAVLPGDSDQSRIKRMLKRSALYRYLRSNLTFLLSDIFGVFHRQADAPVETSANGTRHRDAVNAADYFLKSLHDELKMEGQCVVFLSDPDRLRMYTGKASHLIDAVQVRDAFRQRATELGFRYVNLETAFRAFYANTGRRLDHSPFDRHWNRFGHAVAAAEAGAVLRRCPGVFASSGDRFVGVAQ